MGNTEPSQNAPETGNPAGDADKAKKEFTPITDQAVLDHIIGDRLARERAQYADYAELKKKAEQHDAAEAEKLTEIQKAEKRATDAEAKVAAAEAKALRLEIAAEKGVPAALLTGETREEMEASAKALAEWRGETPANGSESRPPNPNRQQGTQTKKERTGIAAGAAEVAKRFGKKLDAD